MQQKKATIGRVEITWTGKADAVALSEVPTDFLMRKIEEKSITPRSHNLIIEGDNLEALKLLQPQLVQGVSAIYIDPPYNTGNGFVYRDRRDAASWLSMMLPRLVLARNLLRADGAIFVSIDDHEIDRLRLLMGEVFGEENFVAQICVQSNPRGRQADKHFATVHEYLVVYARDHQQCRLAGAKLTAEQLREFNCEDSAGRRYRLLGLRQRGAASLREDRPAMYYPIYVEPDNGSISLDRMSDAGVEVLPKKSTGQAGRWMWGRQKVAESLHLLEARVIARRGEWDIFVHDYLDDANGKNRTRKLKTIWDEKELNYQNGKRELKELLGGEAPVDYPKPTALIRKIISMIADPNAVFLDFFAGSGTLAHAVIDANIADGGMRKYVLIQLPEELRHKRFDTIADVCRERVSAHIARTSAPHGFDYYKLERR